MHIQVVRPQCSITNYVSNIVVIENNNPYGNVVLPLITNGSPSIVFQVSNSGLIWSDNNKMESLVLYGQNIKPLQLTTTGHLLIIAYFLHPHVLKDISGYNAAGLTDMNIDLSISQPAAGLNLKEQLINAKSLNERLQLMERLVFMLARRNRTTTNNAVFYATQAIRKNKGLLPLKVIQIDLNITERTFQRLFELNVGVSPRMFSRICQFTSAFQQLNQKQFDKFGDVACQNGYADQSHLIRTFKQFTNLSPGEYLKNCSAQL